VLPVLGLTVLFSVIPLVMVIQRSLYKGNIFGTDLTFAGLANYADVFRTGGGHSLIVTVVFTAGFVAVTMLLGLGIALLLDVGLPGVRHVRALFVIPLVVPPVATAFIWFTFFQPGTGLFNRLLTGAGLPQVTLSNATDAMIAVIAFGAWQYFGEFVLIYLAALKALPRDVMEAASIDGAGAWLRLRYIRWPLLRHQTALLLVIATLYGLQTFTQIYILTDGGPGNLTEVTNYYSYLQAFNFSFLGFSSAITVALLAATIALSWLIVRAVGWGTKID